jgi:serine/threonine protein kinase
VNANSLVQIFINQIKMPMSRDSTTYHPVNDDATTSVEQQEKWIHQTTPENHSPNNHSAILTRAYTGNISDLLVRQEQEERQRMEPPPIFLLAELEQAKQAYAIPNTPKIIPLFAKIHDRERWGFIAFGFIYPRDGDPLTFQAPKNPTKVAIKVLDKMLVHEYLSNGGVENPYKEVARMQEIGDDVHVLRCIEFLEDDKYLYIVTKEACEKGTLMDYMKSHVLAEDEIRRIFIKILKILDYMHKHHICHHDFKPENLLFLSPNNLVAFDLAMSLRIPVNIKTKQHALITTNGTSGTPAWMSPEAFLGHNQYDGMALDRYGAGVTLFNLLARDFLFILPHLMDPFFRYYIYSGNMWKTETTLEALEASCFPNHSGTLLKKHSAIRSFSASAKILLRGLLHCDPNQRMSLIQAVESEWVRENQV